MWSEFVVFAAPVSKNAPSLEQVLEPADAQALLAQLTIEALHISVLCWLAGLRVNEVDPYPSGQVHAFQS